MVESETRGRDLLLTILDLCSVLQELLTFLLQCVDLMIDLRSTSKQSQEVRMNLS